MPIQFDSLADDACLSAEAPAPQTMAEHCDLTGVGPLLVGGRNQPPLRRPYAQHLEEISGDKLAFHPLGFLPRAQMKSGWRTQRQTGQRRVLLAVVQIVWIRRIAEVTFVRVLASHLNQPSRLGHAAQRPQQERVGQAEDRRIRANPQRQREYGDKREAGIFQQHSQTEAQVLNHFVLPSLTLQPERVPKRAQAAPQQFKFVPPIEPVPAGQQFFTVFQLRFPFLSKANAEASRNDHADESDQPEPETKSS